MILYHLISILDYGKYQQDTMEYLYHYLDIIFRSLYPCIACISRCVYIDICIICSCASSGDNEGQ